MPTPVAASFKVAHLNPRSLPQRDAHFGGREDQHALAMTLAFFDVTPGGNKRHRDGSIDIDVTMAS